MRSALAAGLGAALGAASLASLSARPNPLPGRSYVASNHEERIRLAEIKRARKGERLRAQLAPVGEG